MLRQVMLLIGALLAFSAGTAVAQGEGNCGQRIEQIQQQLEANKEMSSEVRAHVVRLVTDAELRDLEDQQEQCIAAVEEAERYLEQAEGSPIQNPVDAEPEE